MFAGRDVAQGILAGLKVVELAHPLTEFAGCVLAGLGAEVYLVEPPGGAAIRHRKPCLPGADPANLRASYAFLTRNANKRSVVVDLDQAAGSQLLTGLVGQADVLIEAEHTLFADTVAGLVPPTRITLSDRLGLGSSSIVGFAASGGLASSGWPHQPPCNAPGWLALDGASIYAACLGLIGTVASRAGGPPVHYEVPYEEAAIAAITPWTRPLHAYGREALGQGTVTARLGPGGFPIYKARDGYLRVVLGTPRQWGAFVAALGDPEELTSPPWDDPEFRLENRDALQLMTAAMIERFTVEELFHRGQKLGLTITPVSSLNQFKQDRHIQTRQLFVEVDDPDFGIMTLIRPPIVFDVPDLVPPIIPAPALGADNDEAMALAAAPPRVRPTPDPDHDPLTPLSGLRILDLGVGAVVPEAAALLAAFGADVIKVESRSSVDFLRRAGEQGPDDVDACPTFNQLNLGVKSIAVDMKQAGGCSLVRDLLPSCDIVMENMRGGVVSKWRLDYTNVTDQRPDVIYLSSQGLGSGPYDGYQTYGPNLQTFSGVTGQWAHPDDPHPVGTTLNHPDHMAGKQALVPLLAALLRREATGQGIFMEAAQVEASAYLIGERFLEQTFTLGDLAPLGNSSHDFAPHGCYPCAGGDRWVAIAIETDEQWQRLVQCCSPTSDELTHVDLSRRENRLAHTAQLDAWLGLWTSTRSPGEIETVLHNAGLPCSRVVTGDELATNATLHETGFFPTLDHARMGPREYTGMPVQVRGRGRVVVGPPPLLGEHTDDVLSSLDLADVSALRKSGVVGF